MLHKLVSKRSGAAADPSVVMHLPQASLRVACQAALVRRDAKCSYRQRSPSVYVAHVRRVQVSNAT